MLSGSTAGPSGPTPARSGSPRASTGPRPSCFPDRFSWTDRDWKGVRREDLVFYELHVGTFSPEGTFDGDHPPAARPARAGRHGRRDHAGRPVSGRRATGATTACFPYAAQDSYGGPHGLQRLVDACHAAGLAIFLDVVYNHFGPEGNYLGEFGPYFNDRYKTPWGAAVNYDGHGCDAVRDFVLDNVRMWLRGVPLRRPAAGRRPRHLRPGRPAHPPGDQGGGRRGRLRGGAGRRSWSPRAT